MKKIETINFIKKVKGCYPNQFFSDDDVKQEWAKRLEPYDLEDVERKFEEHLKSDMYGDKPPLIHMLIRGLSTHSDKLKNSVDYIIRCNLCGEEMRLSKYDEHYDKCLLITAIIGKAKEFGKTLKYEELEPYTYEKLDKAYYEKYFKDQYNKMEKYGNHNLS